MRRLFCIAIMTLSLASGAGEFDIGTGLGLSGTLLNGVPSLQAGPLFSAGYLTTVANVPTGIRGTFQYDLVVTRVSELGLQVYSGHRFGFLSPYGGVGVTAFLQPGLSFHLHALLGLEGRFGNVFATFVELAPGVLVDRSGAVFWMGGRVGVRLHFATGQQSG